VKKILNTPALLERLTSQGAANLRQDAAEDPNRQRRTHALLGMSVLKKLSSVRYWPEISCETEILLEQIKLPECFNDWEDDDKLGCDDADDFEYDEDE
jgi:hypothetical protein